MNGPLPHSPPQTSTRCSPPCQRTSRRQLGIAPLVRDPPSSLEVPCPLEATSIEKNIINGEKVDSLRFHNIYFSEKLDETTTSPLVYKFEITVDV